MGRPVRCFFSKYKKMLTLTSTLTPSTKGWTRGSVLWGQDKRECAVGANGGQGQAYQAHCEGARKKGLPLLHRPLLFEPTLCLSLRCSCRSPDPSRAHARSD